MVRVIRAVIRITGVKLSVKSVRVKRKGSVIRARMRVKLLLISCTFIKFGKCRLQ